MLKKLILILIVAFFMLMLTGCSWFGSNNTISTNNFYQTDYNYFCLDGDKTWSQIVVCLKAEDDAEKAQNHVTNEMLDKANN